MGTAAATKGVRGAKATPWAAALEKGVEGWSSFTETGSGEDIRTEDGSREVVDSARVRAGAAAASAGAPAADGPVAARSGGDAKSADAKSGGGTGAAAASGAADGKAPSGAADATVAAKRDGDAKDPNNPAGKRPALDQGWRLYRRDVEWQCRWLELRMVEIDGHVDRYQRMLDGIERAKRRGGSDDVCDDAAEKEKTTTTSGEPETTALDAREATRMKRRRQHQGDTPPPNPVLGTHPLLHQGTDDDALLGFRTGKPETLTPAQRKRRKKEAAAQAALADKLANKSGSGTGSDSDLSTAALYEQIEVLQQRVTALHARLGQPAPEMNGIGSVVAIRNNRGANVGAFGGFAREPPKPHVEKLKSRRDDFDINNVVGANEGAKFVERAQHVDICTPGVRPAPTYAMAPINDERGGKRAEKAKAQAEAAAAAAIVAGEGGNAAAVAEARCAGLPDGADDDDSLSEDTSDEAYVHRHAHLETAERKARTLPDKRDKRDKDKTHAANPLGHGGATGGQTDDADSGDGSNKRRKGAGSRSDTPPTPPAVLAEPAVVAEDDGEPELNSAALVGEAPVSMAAADPFARFVPSTTPAPAPEPDAPTMTLQEVMSPPASVPEVRTTVSEIAEAPPCTLTVTLDKSAYNAGETVTGTVKIENDIAMVAKRVEVTIQGRERVTLQRTRVIPEQELAPFHHLQGRSHKEHHARLRIHPKPDVRNLVAEREWRARNGHVSQGKSVTIVEDETQIETVFAERRVVLQLPGVSGGDLPAGTRHEPFSAVIPRAAPSAFYVAGGNWSHGKGYLAEIVYTASAAMVGPEQPGSPGGGGGARLTIGTGPAAPAVELGDGEALLASAKRHFLVTQQLNPSLNPAMTVMSASTTGGFQGGSRTSGSPSGSGPGSDVVKYANPLSVDAAPRFAGPTVSGSRQFMTGGNLRATVTLDRSVYTPGEDSAAAKLEVNCSAAQACTMVGFHAVCAVNLVANSQKWAQTFELQKESVDTRHPGFPPGYYGERFLPLRFPPGWPATTHGALVRCNYGLRCVLYLPKTFDTTLDAPVVVAPSASMYSCARPAGAPFTGPETALPPAPDLPPPRVFRPLWVDDSLAHVCRGCHSRFGVFNRRHHCRQCGHVFCVRCAKEKRPLPRLGYQLPQRVCAGCLPDALRTGGAFTPVEEQVDATYWRQRMAHPGLGPTPPVPTAYARGAGHATGATGGDAEFQREAIFGSNLDGGGEVEPHVAGSGGSAAGWGASHGGGGGEMGAEGAGGGAVTPPGTLTAELR